MKLVLLFCLTLVPALFGEDARVGALLTQGDAEQRQGQTRAALATFHQAEQLEPQNVGVLLRLSKGYSDLVETTKPAAAAEQIAQKSLTYAQRAVQLDPHNAKAHLSVAVGYGKLTDFVSGKTRLEYSKVVKEETDKALALDPSDDFSWHVLARWNFAVANVGPLLKTVASVVYGGLPAASNEEAVRCFKKALELCPGRITHHAALARVYKAMGRLDLEIKEWRAVLALPAAAADDENEKRAAQHALASR